MQNNLIEHVQRRVLRFISFKVDGFYAIRTSIQYNNLLNKQNMESLATTNFSLTSFRTKLTEFLLSKVRFTTLKLRANIMHKTPILR